VVRGGGGGGGGGGRRKIKFESKFEAFTFCLGIQNKNDRQCTYNVTVVIHVTTAAVEKK